MLVHQKIKRGNYLRIFNQLWLDPRFRAPVWAVRWSQVWWRLRLISRPSNRLISLSWHLHRGSQSQFEMKPFQRSRLALGQSTAWSPFGRLLSCYRRPMTWDRHPSHCHRRPHLRTPRRRRPSHRHRRHHHCLPRPHSRCHQISWTSSGPSPCRRPCQLRASS